MRTLDISTFKPQPSLKIATRHGNNDFWVYGDIDMKSQTQKIYRVVIANGGKAVCECPDFVYRKAKTGEACKHGQEVLSKKGAGV